MNLVQFYINEPISTKKPHDPSRTISKGNEYCDPEYSTFTNASPKGCTVSPVEVDNTTLVPVQGNIRANVF